MHIHIHVYIIRTHIHIRPGDELLVLAEDDDSYMPKPVNPKWKMYRAMARDKLPSDAHTFQDPENVLFVGWRRDIGTYAYV